MSYAERPVVFDCGGDALVGIVSAPSTHAGTTGVLVIVGGPQYRAGSHRQFVLLCRHLAAHGIPCMRFDYRGMGDAGGEARGFESVDDDVRTALDELARQVPGTKRYVLWGLCDGASAACLYAPTDPRVCGLVLVNPWVRTAAGEAKAYLKHYYVRRLLQPSFWQKLFTGRLSAGRSARELLQSARLAGSATARDTPRRDLPARMASALRDANLPVLILLSGRDYVANEFDELCKSRPEWAALAAGAHVQRIDAADHTFASAEWRATVAAATTSWVAGCDEQPGAALQPVRS